MSRPIYRGPSAVLLSLCLIAPACGAPGDTETAGSAVAADAPPIQTDRSFNFDLVQRGARQIETPRCKTVCTAWRPVTGHPDLERCVKWGQECNYEVTYLGLYESPVIDGSSEMMPYPEDPFVYRGCGQSAIQNVLAWYGVNMSLSAVYQQTDSWKAWPWTDGHSIATTPNQVVTSLQNLLETWASGPFHVQRIGEAQLWHVTMSALKAGNPLIVMVNSGQHWQVITGFRLADDGVGEYRVIDYPANGGTWVREPDLRRELEGEFKWWAETIGFDGFENNTVVAITRG
jgi:hypothetical protein